MLASVLNHLLKRGTYCTFLVDTFKGKLPQWFINHCQPMTIMVTKRSTNWIIWAKIFKLQVSHNKQCIPLITESSACLTLSLQGTLRLCQILRCSRGRPNRLLVCTLVAKGKLNLLICVYPKYRQERSTDISSIQYRSSFLDLTQGL